MVEEVIRIGCATIIFSIAAVMDWKTREINPYIWLPLLLIGIPLGAFRSLNGLTVYQIISLVVSVIVVCIIAILTFLLKLMGGADFLAIASFTALYPYTLPTTTFSYQMHTLNFNIIVYLLNFVLILPPILTVLLIYTLIMLLFLIHNILHNLKYVDFLKNLAIPLHRKIYFILFHRIVNIGTIFKKRFYYPIFIPGYVERNGFNIYEDDLEWRKKLQGMPWEATIVASWGIPMVTFFSISTLIYIALYLMTLLYGG